MDIALGDHKRNALFAVELAGHLADLRVAVGPGFDLADKDVTVDGTTTTEHKVFFVLVTRANYDFRIGNVSLSPTVGIDLIGETETNIVYGLALGLDSSMTH